MLCLLFVWLIYTYTSFCCYRLFLLLMALIYVMLRRKCFGLYFLFFFSFLLYSILFSFFFFKLNLYKGRLGVICELLKLWSWRWLKGEVLGWQMVWASKQWIRICRFIPTWRLRLEEKWDLGILDLCDIWMIRNWN